MIAGARREGKSTFADRFKEHCKRTGKSLYIHRSDSYETNLYIDRDGVEHEVAKPRGLTFDMVVINEPANR